MMMIWKKTVEKKQEETSMRKEKEERSKMRRSK